MGLFTSLPQRSNGQIISADWFNSIRTTLLNIFSEGYIGETTFNGAASQTDADVTGLVFDNTETESAKVHYTVKTATKFEKGSFDLIYDGSDWLLSESAISGGLSGVEFDVSAAGQVTYDSGAETFLMKFRAETFSI